MTILEALTLGIVQGITEFLPISSSAHLILFPSVFGWDIQSLEFDLALHFGTAFAVLLFFRKDWISMIYSAINDFRSDSVNFLNPKKLRHETKLLYTLIIVTIPVGILGLIFEDIIVKFFRSPIQVAYMMVIVSIFMLFSEFYTRRLKSHSGIEKMSFLDALLISMSQFIALFPGSSRSGMTMSTGLFRGLSRSDAARFSFLLSTPIIVGAVLIKLPDILSFQSESLLIVLIGFVASFLSGLFVIKWLLEFLRKQSFMVFILYRVILSIFILFLFTN